MSDKHIPVLLQESSEYLITKKTGIYFDGTLGFGGHTTKFLSLLNEESKLITTDVDDEAFSFCQNKFQNEKRLKLYKFNYSNIDVIAKLESIEKFDGIFADLGVSSFQLDNPGSGFTFRSDAPLDLRMDKTKSLNAADVVNTFQEEELAKIFFEYGEEKNSRKIAREIVLRRKTHSMHKTTDLVKLIDDITPIPYVNKTLMRVFQAIRIFVNDELGALKLFITKSINLLAPDGRIVILTYHSLEDRIVKDIFKYETISCICPKDFPICTCGKEVRLKILTKKPVVPSDKEVMSNYRSRSAKLRAAVRI
ncbi:MAG: 16S rRNA (cytosine(1402)-N(4))-methyltransferase RsmH [Ignavibacteria bacterium]|nr:16S rRNA (cytosine(1402)-N(4))-methyltransferase RsmH [Ignavibacteria bacterium]